MPTDAQNASPFSLLLIEDNPDDTELISILVEGFSQKMRFFAAEGMEEARSLRDRTRIDVVLCDLNLVESEGLETVKACRNAFPQAALVVLTGDCSYRMPLHFLAAGAQDFLEKGSFDERDLEKAVFFAAERFRHAQEIKRNEEFLDLILRFQPSGLLVLDSEARVIRCNAPAAELLGYAEVSLIGRESPFDLGEATICDVDYCRPDGTVHVLELRVSQHSAAAGGLRLLSILDVTQQRQRSLREAQERRLATVSRVCFGVAHEFNNFLAMTRTKADFLSVLCDSDAAWEAHVEELREGCDRGAMLVEKLMTFYEREVVATVPHSIQSFLVRHEKELRQLCPQGVSLQLSISDEAAYCFNTEEDLKAALLPVLQNAFDASGPGQTVRIVFEPKPAARVGDFHRLLIEDEGAGIAPSDRELVFEPFYSTKGQQAGRGLGLTIVSNIVRRYGGDVEFLPRRGGGTRVALLLAAAPEGVQDSSPREKPAPVARSSDSMPREIPAALGETSRVLVVDDEAIIRFAAQRLLEADGYVTMEAENGEAALAILEDVGQRIDLLLTDISMPGMSGLELLKRARYLRPSLAVVLMSGFGIQGVDQEELRSLGARFIAKPFSRAVLTDALSKSLSEKINPT